MNSKKVVVVGTGASGLAAAAKLLERGFQNVYLVEAENRIGGRVHTVPFGENVVDLGAQWCHGEEGNIVYEMASPLNLLEPTGDTLRLFENIRSNREKLPEKQRKLLQAIVDGFRDKSEENLAEYEGSLGFYAREKFFAALRRTENAEIDEVVAREFFEMYKKLECSSISCDTLDDASIRGELEYWDCEGDLNLIWKDKGYKTFLRLLLKSDEKGTELGVLDQRVMFGKRVNTIVWNAGEQVKLKCDDGDEILADHVVCTVSLGVLKARHSTLFEPALPTEKARAIEGLGFGTINKIILEFPEQFWPNDWTGFIMMWREEDLKEIRQTELAWLEDLLLFEAVKYKPRLLFGWMVGPNARRMETLSEDEVLKGCMYLLKRFLSWDIPTPRRFLRSTWSSNENFRGSYSFHSMVTEKMKTGAVDLQSPLKDAAGRPVVLFAGEATNEHHFATVHGAVETGHREAERLAQFYEDQTSEEEP